jgi:hypothetical protein
MSRAHEIVDHWSVSAHNPPWTRRRDGGGDRWRWVHGCYGARVTPRVTKTLILFIKTFIKGLIEWLAPSLANQGLIQINSI